MPHHFSSSSAHTETQQGIWDRSECRRGRQKCYLCPARTRWEPWRNDSDRPSGVLGFSLLNEECIDCRHGFGGHPRRNHVPWYPLCHSQGEHREACYRGEGHKHHCWNKPGKYSSCDSDPISEKSERKCSHALGWQGGHAHRGSVGASWDQPKTLFATNFGLTAGPP